MFRDDGLIIWQDGPVLEWPIGGTLIPLMPAIAAGVFMLWTWFALVLGPLFAPILDQGLEPGYVEQKKACHISAHDEDLKNRLMGVGLHPAEKENNFLLDWMFGHHADHPKEGARDRIGEQPQGEDDFDELPEALGAQGNHTFPAGGAGGRLI